MHILIIFFSFNTVYVYLGYSDGFTDWPGINLTDIKNDFFSYSVKHTAYVVMN